MVEYDFSDDVDGQVGGCGLHAEELVGFGACEHDGAEDITVVDDGGDKSHKVGGTETWVESRAPFLPLGAFG